MARESEAPAEPKLTIIPDLFCGSAGASPSQNEPAYIVFTPCLRENHSQSQKARPGISIHFVRIILEFAMKVEIVSDICSGNLRGFRADKVSTLITGRLQISSRRLEELSAAGLCLRCRFGRLFQIVQIGGTEPAPDRPDMKIQVFRTVGCHCSQQVAAQFLPAGTTQPPSPPHVTHGMHSLVPLV